MQSWLLQTMVGNHTVPDACTMCTMYIVSQASKQLLMHAWCASCHRQANNSRGSQQNAR